MNEEQKQFRAERLPYWEKTIQSLFPVGIPQRAEWTKRQEIVKILDYIGKKSEEIGHLNHMFYPDGGGLDLTGASLSHEPDCIELHECGLYTGLYTICKPEKLTFHATIFLPDWMYFRLDCKELKPSGVYDLDNTATQEEVTEISPGEYGHWKYGDGQERLQKETRVVTRQFKGSCVIFCKASYYNLVQTENFDAYNAIHNEKTNQEFEQFITSMANKFGD